MHIYIYIHICIHVYIYIYIYIYSVDLFLPKSGGLFDLRAMGGRFAKRGKGDGRDFRLREAARELESPLGSLFQRPAAASWHAQACCLR